MDGSGLVLIAEDNSEDMLLLKKALEKAGVKAQTQFVRDGEEVLLYLQGLGVYSNRDAYPIPNMIILDIKMPKRSGLEVLQWLSEHREFAVVPTVVLSSSNLESDVRKAYHLGANTYFVKPSSFDELVNTVKALQLYWAKAQKVRARPLTSPSTHQ
jgi:CheY-like chemotaxis protein